MSPPSGPCFLRSTYLEPGPHLAPDSFLQAFGFMAWHTKPLFVRLIIRTTFGQWLDVVTLGGQGDAASGFAHGAQWRTGEQFGAHALQLAASGALGGGCLGCPGWLGVLGAPARSVSHQHTAARMAAGFGGREHGQK